MRGIVPDTGVLVDGRLSEILRKTSEEKAKITISQSVIAELEHQANSGKETGFAGLDELKKLNLLQKSGKIELHFEGERPSASEILDARFGGIDAKIRALAKKLNAVLLTTDKVQHEVCEAEGIPVQYLEPIVEKLTLPFEKYFSEKNTLSVHLKENCKPKAKIGLPGNFELREISEKKLSRSELFEMIKRAVEFSKREERSFIEIDKQGATVLQIQDYRVTFTKPPFSEAAELTVVRPIAKLSIGDYSLSENLFKRLSESAEGILIAGPPGSGKSTFATALAEHYASGKKIVKTLEQPRDLQVSSDITQYAPLEGSFVNTADIILLVRPDYTIYDEIRKPDDFRIFSDLRMSGIGMVGVVHASKPIDAIQRFIGKIELGMIPQVIDTIVFISKGNVAKVYELKFSVKVPYGMFEQDLARPVIEVNDFDTKKSEFEIYKWGEETVVFPLPSGSARAIAGRGAPADEGKIRRTLDSVLDDYDLEILGNKLILFIQSNEIARVIGKKGKRIKELEKRLGMKIDIKPV